MMEETWESYNSGIWEGVHFGLDFWREGLGWLFAKFRLILLNRDFGVDRKREEGRWWKNFI